MNCKILYTITLKSFYPNEHLIDWLIDWLFIYLFMYLLIYLFKPRNKQNF